MLPSSIARQVAGTLPDQLAHLRMDLARFAAEAARDSMAGRGERLPDDLRMWLRANGLPDETKAPKPVRAVLSCCAGRFGDGLRTLEVAAMVGVSETTAREGLISLAEQGRVVSAMVVGVKGRALFWMEVK